ncbi:hypothetical protein NL676_034687 [Syzygium grande]|nr:hypothetical protein NL676_034687 [Syzygium grande]
MGRPSATPNIPAPRPPRPSAPAPRAPAPRSLAAGRRASSPPAMRLARAAFVPGRASRARPDPGELYRRQRPRASPGCGGSSARRRAKLALARRARARPDKASSVVARDSALAATLRPEAAARRASSCCSASSPPPPYQHPYVPPFAEQTRPTNTLCAMPVPCRMQYVCVARLCPWLAWRAPCPPRPGAA